MIGEIAHFLALASALGLILVLIFNAFFYSAGRHANQDILSYKLFHQSCLLIFISFGLYIYLAITDDFSISYIANHSNSQLPIFYKITSIWSAHEGSMFLWIVFLTLWSTLFINSLSFQHQLKKGTMLMLTIIILGFLLFLLITSNPFERILPFGVLEGADINPVLQDPALAIHPPLLYLGYVGFVISFSFITAYLFHGDIHYPWEKDIKNWSLIAWIFLTVGITLGSWWAYYELGWGGYWFWDPVENASLMPWLAATALIHSNIVTLKKDKLHSWTALLSIFTFIMSLLGTFLVRSGVLNSVHAFANDPYRGVYILSTILFITFFSLAIFIIKSPKKSLYGEYSFLQKDNFILINNCFLIFFLSVILVGTVYPIILDAISGKSISVGPVYYHTILAPFLFAFLFFMSHGPLISWNKEDKFLQIKNFKIFFPISIAISSVIIFWFFDYKDIILILGLLFSVYLIVSVIFDWISQKKLSLNFGRLVSHLGFGTLIFAIFVNAYLSKEINAAMKVGEEITIQEFVIKFKSINKIKKENYEEVFGNFLVTNKKKQVELTPSIRKYDQPVQFTSETSIKTNFIVDYYFAINLSEFEKDKIMVRFYYKPLMFWIWFSILLIAFGGIYQTFRLRNE